MDLLSKGVRGFRGDRLLRGQPSNYFCPKTSLSGLLELVADGVDYPISQQTEEKVRVGFLIALVVYGALLKVRLQLSVARLYFADEIVSTDTFFWVS